MLYEYNFNFDPNLNIVRIHQRKLRRKLLLAVYAFLFFVGALGLLFFLGFYIIFRDAGHIFLLRFFYYSLLTDCFLLFLWQRRQEKIKKVRLPSPNEKINIWDYFNKDVEASLEGAFILAFQRSQPLINPIHLLISFLKLEKFEKTLKRLNCQMPEVKIKAKNILNIAEGNPEKKFGSAPKVSPDLEKIFFDAYNFCLRQELDQIGPLQVLWAMSQKSASGNNIIEMIFDEFGISSEEMQDAALWSALEEKITNWRKKYSWQSIFKPKGQLNRAMTAAATPFLNRVSQDYTQAARSGMFEIMLGRQKLVDNIFSLWSSGSVGVVLTGESGVGKKSVVQNIAQMMVQETVPKYLQDKRMVKLDLGALLSDAKSSEQNQDILKRIIYEIRRAGHIVVFIEDIDNLVGLKTQSSGLDFAEIIAEALDNKYFYLIATSTSDAYASKIEKGILGRVLSPVIVKNSQKEDLLQILMTRVYMIEKELDIVYSVDALNKSIDLADRFLYGQALTAKAIDLLEEAGSIVRGQKGSGGLVRDEDIAQIVSKKTDIPLTQVKGVEKEKLLNLEELIHRRLINQKKAVLAVADALRRARVQLEKKHRPIANFLFVGPTGVGKTELAKTLCSVYFGDERRMIRLDMSEYQEKKSLRRLIGDKTETETHKGFLTESIKRQPHSLVLLDEIEKAHSDILNLFLQIMDDGRLTDAANQTVNFSNVIIIATSNAGTKNIQDQIIQGKTYDEINNSLRSNILLEHFAPEFLNRFDQIILFQPLALEEIIKIAQIFLDKIITSMSERGIDLSISEEAIKELAKAGYDPIYGARPLRRTIQERVEDNLAKMLLSDKIAARDKVILKRLDDFEIIKAPKI